MKLKTLSLYSIIFLAGCAQPTLYLIDKNNKENIVTYSTMTKSMEVTRNGVLYKGNYVTDSKVGYGNVQTYGAKPAFGATQVYTPGSNGRAILFASNGDKLSCEFTYDDNTAIGVCTNNNGDKFDLVTKPKE